MHDCLSALLFIYHTVMIIDGSMQFVNHYGVSCDSFSRAHNRSLLHAWEILNGGLLLDTCRRIDEKLGSRLIFSQIENVEGVLSMADGSPICVAPRRMVS